MPRTIATQPALAGLLQDQDGIAAIRQLASYGLSSRTVNKRIARGVWQRVLPGVLATTTGALTRRQRLIAAWLWAGPSSAIDGIDAARWYGLDRPHDDLVHIVVKDDAPHRSRDFVVVRRAQAEIVVGARGAVPYVDAATAVVVAARNARTNREAVGRLSRALQQEIVTVAELAEARERIGDKWCRGVDGALIAVGVGLRSSAERDMHDLVASSKVLPAPLWNQWLDLGDDGPSVCVDALLPDAGLASEVIGKKYHAWGEQYDDTNARKERLQAAGLIVCEATPVRIRKHGEDVLSKLERTYERYAGRGMPPGIRLISPPRIAQ